MCLGKIIEEKIVTCGQMLQVSIEDWDVDVSSQAEIERLYIFILNAQIQLMQVGLALCTYVGISLYMIASLDREKGICPSPCIKKYEVGRSIGASARLTPRYYRSGEKGARHFPFWEKVCRSLRSPARTEANVLRPFRARRRRESAERREVFIFENTYKSELKIDGTRKEKGAQRSAEAENAKTIHILGINHARARPMERHESLQNATSSARQQRLHFWCWR